MAFDLTGLINQNEFYPDHYWHEVLPDRVKDFEKRWKAREFERVSEDPNFRPWLKIKALSAVYLSARKEFAAAGAANLSTGYTECKNMIIRGGV